jgi:rare lipoprotein A
LFISVTASLSCAREPNPEAPPPLTPEAGAYQTGWATYYASRFAGRTTANGERYDPGAMTAAHRTLPFGTIIRVQRDDGRSVVVRVNDRGPYVSGRIVDLSYRAASELGMIKQGKIWVQIQIVLPPRSPAMASVDEP